jgi:hypothetical protein
MKTVKLFLPCLFVLSSSVVKSQDFDWWKNNVQWDGVTHWYKYLIISPKYFGPNALPVPSISNGSIDSLTSIGATLNLHFSNGDNTQNAMFYGNYTSKNNSISVDAQFVPFEMFQMTKAKKEERRVYYTGYYKSNTVGDVIINTTAQIFKQWQKTIYLTARVGVRMPSGGAQEAVRYTDGPGYWINLGWGKPFRNKNYKWIGMAGFMAWQTNDDTERQDDAFVFGSGLEWNHAGLRVQSYVSGYLGWRHDGDKPVVFRLNVEKRKKKTVYLFHFQQGLHDFGYSSFETGTKIILGK